ncbi:hypothetical protein NQZ68_029523 [Dissostichus eleginoides]|nr:hypothetical protein NQZ68_029523 [Dissostichus eleginoides]
MTARFHELCAAGLDMESGALQSPPVELPLSRLCALQGLRRKNEERLSERGGKERAFQGEREMKGYQRCSANKQQRPRDSAGDYRQPDFIDLANRVYYTGSEVMRCLITSDGARRRGWLRRQGGRHQERLSHLFPQKKKEGELWLPLAHQATLTPLRTFQSRQEEPARGREWEEVGEGGLYVPQVTQEMPGKGWGPYDCFNGAGWFSNGQQKKLEP